MSGEDTLLPARRDFSIGIVGEGNEGKMESEKMEEEKEVKTEVKIGSVGGNLDMKEILVQKRLEAKISKPKLNLMRRKEESF